MSPLENDIHKSLLALPWERDSHEYFFLVRLKKWTDRDLTIRGRSYLLKLFGSRLSDLPNFHSFEVRLLAEKYGNGIHDLYRVLAAIEMGKQTLAAITSHVWASGYAKVYLPVKGKKEWKEKIFPVNQYGLSFLTKIVLDGFLFERNGKFEYTTAGFSILYLYRIKSDPKELELINAGEMVRKPKNTFLPFPIKRRTLL